LGKWGAQKVAVFEMRYRCQKIVIPKSGTKVGARTAATLGLCDPGMEKSSVGQAVGADEAEAAIFVADAGAGQPGGDRRGNAVDRDPEAAPKSPRTVDIPAPDATIGPQLMPGE